HETVAAHGQDAEGNAEQERRHQHENIEMEHREQEAAEEDGRPRLEARPQAVQDQAAEGDLLADRRHQRQQQDVAAPRNVGRLLPQAKRLLDEQLPVLQQLQQPRPARQQVIGQLGQRQQQDRQEEVRQRGQAQRQPLPRPPRQEEGDEQRRRRDERRQD